MLQSNGLVGKISTKESITAKLNNKEVQVYPEIEDLIVTPSAEEQHFKSDKYGYDNVTVKAVESEEITIVPGAEEQTKEGMFKKVTVAGDNDLIPENIKEGKEIFGIVGINADTFDANATSEDILNGKTAYVDNKKIVGTFESLDTSDATATSEDILEGKIAYVKDEKIIGTMPINTNNATIDITGETSLGYTLSYYIAKIDMLDTSLVTSLSAFFQSCERLKTIPLLNTSNVTNMQALFRYCSSLKTVPLLDTSKVTNMAYMFDSCTSLETIPLLETGNVTNMTNMFNNCKALKTIPLLNTSNVTNMTNMVYLCEVLQTIPQFDTGKVTNMTAMFRASSSLETIPLLNTEKVTNMYDMFNSCTSLKSVPLLNTSNVTNISSMFNNCASLETIPQLDTAKVTNISNAFRLCPELTDESLNNILAMCTNAVKITNTNYKKLSYIGLTSDQATRCQSLSNYQAFLDAGWTTGY